MTDRQLIERLARGDTAAARLLFEAYYARIYRFIARQAIEDSVVEELTNEVFLDVWRQAGQYEGRAAVSTWMFAIARNKARAHWGRRREAPLDLEAAETVADTADTPEVTSQKRDKADAIRRAIDRLSPDHRATIDLVYYHDMTMEEVGEVLGIPANTVKTRIFHARRRLGDLLRGAGVDRGWP